LSRGIFDHAMNHGMAFPDFKVIFAGCHGMNYPEVPFSDFHDAFSATMAFLSLSP
jgi:hypothetical protein